jgi:type VI secretion system protein ImpL
VGQFCTAALAGRYPFARGSAKDATADDFAKMFAPGGLMDDFFQKHLATMVDTSTRPWSFKKGIDGGAFGGSAGLIAFQRAAVIRDAFFPGGAKTPLLKFAIRLADMDASFSQVAFDVDGQVQKFGPGPQVPASVTWPGARGGQQVSIQTLPASGGASALTGEGPWALHHLFDKARIRPADAQERFVADFNVEGRKITLEVIANSVLNPFRLRELSEFQCPRGL